ncbi:MAG: polynucleotide adenylyltransferase PcnB [Pseudomonadales bacterium]|nr:polynucleotide adenylyltransferase PcnB [Pseudomonadales bacterium]MCP5322016.1 polynucleotide adenylyltransferase PcnB [Pseudomonadales bacterium]MCP5338073.1 polynucleotide adenylyltransferase PcnB [Pseudomonadales bacterium]
MNQAPDESLRTIAASRCRRYGSGEHRIPPQSIPAQALWVYRELRDAGYEAYLVGGCVRDLLLGYEPKDFDVSTSAHPDEIRSVFRRSRIVGRRFQIVHVRSGRDVIEVSTFRGHHGADFDADDEEELPENAAAYAESGMLLRDNVFGTVEEDALRRDFTVNGLYYDPDSDTVLDFSSGVADLEARVLRVIGDPVTRFQEDPVRMLRAARFAAKLGFTIDTGALAAIGRCRDLLDQIPAARLFDEVLKLLLTGRGEDTFTVLDELGLFAPIFPETARALAAVPEWRSLILHALRNSDERIALGKPVTPAFLYAAMLWPALARRVESLMKRAQLPALAAIGEAAPEVIVTQCRRTVIPRRFSTPMREIWELQQRLLARRSPQKLAVHPRFRAAYDFVLLREQAGEQLDGAGDWWTRFQNGESVSTTPTSQRRRRRRRPPGRNRADGD